MSYKEIRNKIEIGVKWYEKKIRIFMVVLCLAMLVWVAGKTYETVNLYDVPDDLLPEDAKWFEHWEKIS